MRCSADDCNDAAICRGWCSKHYARWRSNGDPNVVRKKQPKVGEPGKFLEQAILYTGQDCLIWPYGRGGNGYAQINPQIGNPQSVHRIVCERVNGPAPIDKPCAIHSCGNGHLGCVAPLHLRWADRAENGKDMVRHGRSLRGERHNYVKLNERAVLEIFRRATSGENLHDLADEFRVSVSNISCIKLGKSWAWLTGAVPRRGKEASSHA